MAVPTKPSKRGNHDVEYFRKDHQTQDRLGYCQISFAHLISGDAGSISGAPRKITIDELGRPKRCQLNRTTSFDDGQAA